MEFTGLKLNELPLVLAGPILRRTEPEQVTVWVALKERRTVGLAVRDGGTVVLEEKRDTVELGTNLHIAAVTAEVSPPQNLLAPGRTYTYDLRDVDNDVSLLGEGLTYDGGPELPSFVLPPDDIAKLSIVHASCRKPHGEGRDMLAHLDELIEDSIGTPEGRPQMLFLTGDQIYADDVADALLLMLQDAVKVLEIPDERLPGVAPGDERLNPGNRSELVSEMAKFTVDKDVSHCHLLTFGEFCAMYLFAWSPVLWPGAFGEFTPESFFPQIALQQQLDLHVRLRTQQPHLARFFSSLGSVRRAMANIPTYMIFDDHEVTDDLFLDRDWTKNALGAPLGRRIIQNGLAACALFQAWGNTYQQFDDGELGDKLLGLLPKLEHRNQLDECLGLPTDAQLGDWRAGRVESLGPRDRALPFHFALKMPECQVLFLNIRTHRGFPAGSGDEPAQLISKGGLERQIPDRLQGQAKVTFVVSPTPVFGVGWIEVLQTGLRWARSKHKMDYERWNLEEDSFARLLSRLSRLGIQAGAKKHSRIVILSGDVHYGYAARIQYSNENADATIAHFTASSLKNQTAGSFGTLSAQERGYDGKPLSPSVSEPPLRKIGEDGPRPCYVLRYSVGTQNPPATSFPALATLAEIVGLLDEVVPDGSQIVGYNNLGEIHVVSNGSGPAATQKLHWSISDATTVATSYSVPLTIETLDCA